MPNQPSYEKYTHRGADMAIVRTMQNGATEAVTDNADFDVAATGITWNPTQAALNSFNNPSLKHINASGIGFIFGPGVYTVTVEMYVVATASVGDGTWDWAFTDLESTPTTGTAVSIDWQVGARTWDTGIGTQVLCFSHTHAYSVSDGNTRGVTARIREDDANVALTTLGSSALGGTGILMQRLSSGDQQF